MPKPPAAAPNTPKKPRDVDEGNGTVRVPLSEEELAKRGIRLANRLHAREEEIDAQAHMKKAMAETLSEIDMDIHMLQTSIRERSEEVPTPGLFEETPVGEGVMAPFAGMAGMTTTRVFDKDGSLLGTVEGNIAEAVLSVTDDAEKGYPPCERERCGHKYSEHAGVVGGRPGQTLCVRNGTSLACGCAAYMAEPRERPAAEATA